MCTAYGSSMFCVIRGDVSHMVDWMLNSNFPWSQRLNGVGGWGGLSWNIANWTFAAIFD